MPFKQKLKLVIACVFAGLLLAAAIAFYVFRYEIGFLQNSKAGLDARTKCDFLNAEKELLIAADCVEHFSPIDARRYVVNLSLAQMYVATGSFAKANQYIERARENAKSNVQNQLTVMSLTAESLYRQAKFDEAAKIYCEMIELAKKNKQTIFEIDALFALTKMDVLFLKLAEAEKNIDQIEILQRKLAEPTNASVVLQIYAALVAEIKGRYKTSLELYEFAERIFEDQEKSSSALKLSIANNSAAFLLLDRNTLRAKNMALRALDNSDKDFESYFAGNLLMALRTVVGVYIAENDTQHARQFVDREIAEVAKRLSKEHPMYGRALEHRALIESREGKKEESERDFKLCQTIFESSLGPQNRLSADTLADIARAQMERGEISEASETCKRSIAMYKAILPCDHPSVLNAEFLLSLIYKQQNKPDKAHQLEVEYNEGFGAADGK